MVARRFDKLEQGRWSPVDHAHSRADEVPIEGGPGVHDHDGVYSPAVHTHPYADEVHTHVEAEITDLGSYAADVHSHVEADISDLNHVSSVDDLTDVDTSTTPPTDGQALVWDNGSSLWVPGDVAAGGGGGAVYAGEMRRAADLSWTGGDGGEGIIPWDTLGFDVGGFADLANYQFVAQEDGPHLFGATLHFPGTDPNETRMKLYINGTTEVWLERTDPGGTFRGFTGSGLVNLTAGDTVALRVWTQSSCTIRGGIPSRFWGFKVGGGGAVPGSWETPTLLNSWTNFGGAYATAAYRKDSLGVVHLRGLITGGTKTATTVLFNLPSGYRPAADLMFATSVDNGSWAGFGSFNVKSNGDVMLRVAGSGPWISLDGCSFLADGA